MEAAAVVFFRMYSGPTDACKKLSLGDPKKATPHIIYYLNKIKASAELQSSLAMALKEKQTDAGKDVRSPDPTGATVGVGEVISDTVESARAATPMPALTPSGRPTGGYKVQGVLLHSAYRTAPGRDPRDRRARCVRNIHVSSFQTYSSKVHKHTLFLKD